jgi:hypothetical protein
MSATKTYTMNTVNHKDIKKKKKKNKMANGAIHDIFYTKHKNVLYFQNISICSQYMGKFNCIYAHKKRVVFAMQIFAKLGNAQKHYV